MPKISAPTIAAHRAQTRERIMAAVASLTRTQGIDEISMTDVAAAAGITRTALYNYFPDKPALLLAFTEQVTSGFVRRYQDELPSDATAAERMSVFVRFQLEGIVQHPHPAAAELGASLGPDAYQALADHVAPMQRLLVEILRAGMAADEFDAVPAEATAKLVLALIGAQRVPLSRGETAFDDAHALVTAFALRALGVDAGTVERAVHRRA
ncbi:TetR/AcrR family transcriptional regulator [Marinitenerispora sediminis]|uniref:TetR/AcrR family transcriptional regulator n=1 Tax=Marinitenerispora sediminis TaxID=1931232 RepID=A0A368T6T0_9ACTN|nr:TetR/AcrR family transcriptional regulator [Marinitenerispora sediminis]RCV52300.1 TetR/AcrR family transcriptional regulator [Marinitenerispora sediminis]RCV58840.1 TetR/AcrR family transcriptional regulator [Marinitenerispora sediminis]RCV59358.1 TetR/AcrR family transcriptional regulator [Marinitenerispora sediminis]